MNTITKLQSKIHELRNYIEENTDLEVEIETSQYPITISFYECQCSMFADENTDAVPSLCFIFEDEMRIVTAEELKITETVFNKLKNLSKEVNRLYLHAFREEIDKVLVPMWDCINSTAKVTLYREKFFDNMMKRITE